MIPNNFGFLIVREVIKRNHYKWLWGSQLTGAMLQSCTLSGAYVSANEQVGRCLEQVDRKIYQRDFLCQLINGFVCMQSFDHRKLALIIFAEMNRNAIVITARKPLLGEESGFDYYDAKCEKRVESETEFFRQLRFIHKSKIKGVRMVSPYEWTIIVRQ